MATDMLNEEFSSGAVPGALPLLLNGVGFDVRGNWLLRDIDFELRGGGPTLFLGPNGAGKSLLLRICHGLLEATAGQISWGGAANPVRQSQAMVFQRPVMLRRSVTANIDYLLRQQKLTRAERQQRIDAALARADLTAVARSPAPMLSGGEQQRLALARAWVMQPKLLFLDEPTASLDPAATRKVESMLAEISAAGTKIVMSTHDLGQAKRLAEEVLFLHQGRITEHTGSAQFFQQPVSAPARAFVAGELFVSEPSEEQT
jgi:tungstate transport system ATP-binding protein